MTGSGGNAGGDISIDDVDPDIVFVPVYTSVVYGAWPYADALPYDWSAYPEVPGRNFGFAPPQTVGAAFWGRWDWHKRHIVVDPARFRQFNPTKVAAAQWQFDASRRKGAPFKSPILTAKFKLGQAVAAPSGVPSRRPLDSVTASPVVPDAPAAGKRAHATTPSAAPTAALQVPKPSSVLPLAATVTGVGAGPKAPTVMTRHTATPSIVVTPPNRRQPGSMPKPAASMPLTAVPRAVTPQSSPSVPAAPAATRGAAPPLWFPLLGNQTDRR